MNNLFGCTKTTAELVNPKVAQTTANNTKTIVSNGLRSSHEVREHYEIISDMVKTVQSGPRITYNGEKKSLCKLHQVTCGALVPLTNVRKYLQFLTTQNLLISSNIGDDICYEIGDKGY
jgi:predicted transcriptional regulator